MKHFYSYTLIAFFCFGSGLFFFLIQKEFVIVQWSFLKKTNLITNNTTTKRNLALYCWNGQQYIDHHQSIVWHRNNHVENLKLLVHVWLQFAHAEKIIAKPVAVQSVLWPTSGQEAYLSFDQNILDPQWSIQKKIFFIEGLLKTITQANIPLHHLVFLVNHTHILDEHLDFSYPWPIDGFVTAAS